jgi:hypothetical protein
MNERMSITNIEACIKDIDAWMLSNKLKLNRGKTELLVIGSKFGCRPCVEIITVAGEHVNGQKRSETLESSLMKALT